MISKTLLFLKKIGIRTLLVAVKGLIYFKKIIITILIWTVVKPLWWFGKTVLFSLAIKIYKIYFFLKIKWDKIYAPIKKKFIYPLTRRYVTHSVIIMITVFSVASNITAKEISLENVEQIGQKSILYNLSYAEENSEGLIQETAETSGAKTLSYLEKETGAILQSPLLSNTKETTVFAPDQDAFLNPTLPSTILNLNPKTKITEYIVQEGDVISTIAEKFNLKINTILWANKLNVNDMIRPGDKLLILPVDGVLHQVKKADTLSKIAKYYDADAEKIQEFNALADEKDLIVGEYLIIPNGKIPPPLPPAPKPRSRLAAPRDILKIPPSKTGAAGMIWPTSGKVITQYFTWRHVGLDIDGDYTSPIYAAESGTVKYVGWGRGYGNQIVISHGNGTETRYAHLSKFFVEQGDVVTKGQAIGMMGSTGWSTGTHLHFEVIINGKRVNPLNYL